MEQNRASFSALSSRVFDVVIGSLARSSRGFGHVLVGAPPLIEWAELDTLVLSDPELVLVSSLPDQLTHKLLAPLAKECAAKFLEFPALWSDSRLWPWASEVVLVLFVVFERKKEKLPRELVFSNPLLIFKGYHASSAACVRGGRLSVLCSCVLHFARKRSGQSLFLPQPEFQTSGPLSGHDGP